MHRSPPLTLATAVAGLAALATLASCTTPPGEDPSLLFGRVWIDSKPEKPTDYAQAAFLLSRPAVGVFQRASNYDFHFERFDYHRDAQTLELTFPQTGKAAKLTFTISSCNTLPPYDLCLDLSENPWGGPKRYFGMRAQDDDDAAARSLRAHLPPR